MSNQPTRRQLDEQLATLANECHATFEMQEQFNVTHGQRTGLMDFDAARLCRRYMGWAEPYDEYLKEKEEFGDD